MSTDNKNFGGKDQGKQKPMNPQQTNRTGGGAAGGAQQGGLNQKQQGGHQQGQNAWDQNKGNVGGKKDRDDQR
jgi:hypothetical protein